MLEIVDLHAEVNGKEILRGINLSVKAGEVHAIMGPNGSGKSKLGAWIEQQAFDSVHRIGAQRDLNFNENIALKKHQKELEAERDRLSKELKNSEDREYVEEKAREQLRLLNEGEILFLFDDDDQSSKGADDKDE